MIRAAVIDDEPDAITVISSFLQMHFPDMTYPLCFTSPTEAASVLSDVQPDLVFMDIEMPQYNGFDLLSEIKHDTMQLIFVTAHDHYAIRAIKANAIDYLLKPVDEKEFVNAVNNALQRIARKERSNVSLAEKQKFDVPKIKINTGKSIRFLAADQVCHVQAEGNYSRIFLENNKKLIANGQLHELETELANNKNFLRVHRSYIVNLEKVLEFTREGYLFLLNGAKVPVSKKYKSALRFKLGIGL